MSAQTDCEMLSIEVMEAYAGKYNLSGNKVVELFQKNQVFEKMLIQHEYLHQVSFEEVMEFVENVIVDASRELVVYHGTVLNLRKLISINRITDVILERDFIQRYCNHSQRNGHTGFHYEKNRTIIMYMNFYLRKCLH